MWFSVVLRMGKSSLPSGWRQTVGKQSLSYAISLKMVLELREIKVSEITGAIIGSVVPPVTSLMREAIRKVTGQEALVVNVDMNIGLEVLMDNPSSVGTDLI